MKKVLMKIADFITRPAKNTKRLQEIAIICALAGSRVANKISYQLIVVVGILGLLITILAMIKHMKSNYRESLYGILVLALIALFFISLSMTALLKNQFPQFENLIMVGYIYEGLFILIVIIFGSVSMYKMGNTKQLWSMTILFLIVIVIVAFIGYEIYKRKQGMANIGSLIFMFC